MDQQPPRNVLDKERFLKGNRQKWLVVFLLAMVVIMILDALHYIERVDSYLTFLTFLSGSFILGYSGTETMKLFTVNSSSQNVNTTTNTNTTSVIREEKFVNLTHNGKEEDYEIAK